MGFLLLDLVFPSHKENVQADRRRSHEREGLGILNDAVLCSQGYQPCQPSYSPPAHAFIQPSGTAEPFVLWPHVPACRDGDLATLAPVQKAGFAVEMCRGIPSKKTSKSFVCNQSRGGEGGKRGGGGLKWN